MLGTAINELALTIAWTPVSPLLFKAGDSPAHVQAEEGRLERMAFGEMIGYYERLRAEEERAREEKRKQRTRADRDAARHARESYKESPDMRFVRTWRNGREEPFLPGSSLKGVLRAWSERLSRTMCAEGRQACDPFAAPCVDQWRDRARPAGPEAYNQVCPVCRTFGHLFLAGRLGVSDAYLDVNERLSQPLTRRDGVGIDRKRGAAADGAKYDYEVWDRGPFYGAITLCNFEIWQVGLLAYLVAALAGGEVRFGHGTRRGLGKLEGRVDALSVTYFGAAARRADGEGMPLLGLHHVLQADETRYRFYAQPAEPPRIPGATFEDDGLRRTWHLDAGARDALWAATGPVWNAFAEETSDG